MVSVVLPVFNGMPWVREAVESIQGQSFTEWELIVVDDGSTDGTLRYLEALCDGRVRIERLEEHRGIVAALNHGIARARGRYVARMDADDVAHPDRLARQVEFLDENPEYVLVSSFIRAFPATPSVPTSEVARFEACYNREVSDGEIRRTLPVHNCLNHPAVLMRKEAVDAAGGYGIEFQHAEDYELFWRLSKVGKLGKIPERLLRYRVHPAQVSRSRFEEQRGVDARIKTRILLTDYCSRTDRLLLWGAGPGGALVARELQRCAANPVGFIDMDETKWGTTVAGLPVLGGTTALPSAEPDFVVLTTTPGRKYATAHLEQRGWEFGKNFIPVW